MVSNRKRLARRRQEEADRQGWRCYWCQVEMTPLPRCTKDGRPAKTAVTLDHLFARGDLRRLLWPKPGESRYVAACRKCNEQRGDLHSQSLLRLYQQGKLCD